MKRIKITSGKVTMEAQLEDESFTRALCEALPIRAEANLWGDEIYFSIPLNLDAEAELQEIVEFGDLGFWPPGKAFCIFFGPTPVSSAGEIRPASAVHVFGRIIGDAKAFRKVKDGATVVVDAVE